MTRGIAAAASLVLALAAIFALAAPASAQRRGDPAELLESGREAYEESRWERARTDLWAYLEATATLTGPSRLPQAEALFYIARMEPDAGVAAQHYQTIVDEYPAARVADEALFRLGQYALVTGRAADARERFLALKQNYPVSRLQGELPLWVGRTFLDEGRHRAATDAMIEGFSRLRTQDLPYEISGRERDALAAEYAYWLARAFHEEGDERTAIQYWSLLSMDYADSPQAIEARAALAALGRPVAVPGAVASAEPPPAPAGGDPVYRPIEPPPAREDVARGEPEREAPIREEPPPRETPAEIDPRVRQPEPEREREAPPAVVERAAPAEDLRVRRPSAGEQATLEEAPKFPPPTPSAGTIFLQVGAFSSASRAADLSRRLKQDGLPSQVEVAIVEGQGYYRVRVGPYRLPAQSDQLREAESRLRELGYPVRPVQGGS